MYLLLVKCTCGLYKMHCVSVEIRIVRVTHDAKIYGRLFWGRRSRA